MELRGFDTYTVTLGDEMRGERASLNKSLSDVERDLRIKGAMIAAIEDCDLSAFANHSVVAGYVRCYSRYLGMNVDTCYQRFCEESGFRSPVAMFGSSDPERSGTDTLNSQVGSQLAASRFAAPPLPTRFSPAISMGGLVSTLALMTILGGVSYGGYAFLQDIQRVGFAPLVEAPDVVAEAPEIEQPVIDTTTLRPSAADYAGDGVLAGLDAPDELPISPYPRRDGPISAIDPATYGVFARPEIETLIREGLASGVIDSADDAILASTVQTGNVNPGSVGPALDGKNGAVGGDTQASTPTEIAQGITVHATEETWVRIRESQNNTLFEAVMGAGDHFDLPARVDAPVLRSGNAGGVYLRVDGVIYGPVGGRGKVVKNISLSAEAIRDQLPRSDDQALLIERDEPIVDSIAVAFE